METVIESPASEPAASEAPENTSVAIPWHERSWLLFTGFLVIGSFVLLFTLLTVNNRRSAEIASHPYAQRANAIISHWIQNGYFRSGGLMYFRFGDAPKPFYYRSTGVRMLSGFIVEKIHWMIRGRYNWRLFAVHNQVITLLFSALVALLAFRLARRLGVDPLHALALSAGAEFVAFTFPDNLGLYWETSGQLFALMFAVLFLLLEERSSDRENGRGFSWTQVLVAFAIAYSEFIFGFFFFVAYAAFVVILDRGKTRVRPLLMKTAIPYAIALTVFGLQWTWVTTHYPETPRHGSGFLFRSGLDGSSQYYGDHLDIAFGRDLPRHTFRQNRELLLRWEGLFFGGLAAMIGIGVAFIRSRAPRFVFFALMTLIAAYVLYAAVFSQSFVIHPYLYDILLATPLLIALFVVAPSLLESITRFTGIVVLLAFLGALAYSMMQIRLYALRYPLAASSAAASTRAAAAKGPLAVGEVRSSGALFERGRTTAVGEWIAVPFDAALFKADRGAKWTVEKVDVEALSYSIVGNTMTVAFRLMRTSVSGGASVLYLKIPEGRKARGWISNSVVIIDNGSWAHSFAQTDAGTDVIHIFRIPTGAWADSDNKTGVIGQITFGVQ